MFALTGGTPDWLGFPVRKIGRVLYLQVDTPRSTWIRRFRVLHANGWKFNHDRARFADRKSLELTALNLIDPRHRAYIREMIEWVMEDPLPAGADYPAFPIAVVVDTMRRVHLGNENDSTDQQAVMNALTEVINPAALILISHQRKAQGEVPDSVVEGNRGSNTVSGEADIICQMSPTKKGAKPQLHRPRYRAVCPQPPQGNLGAYHPQ